MPPLGFFICHWFVRDISGLSDILKFTAWKYTIAYADTVLVLFPSGVYHLTHVHPTSPESSATLSTTYEATKSNLTMAVPPCCNMPSSSWVLCPVLVLVVTSVLIRS